MYADLLREYGVDMRGLLEDDPTTTPALVLALIEGLPLGSKTSAILREAPESAGWDTSDYLTAALIDSVRDGTFVNMQVRTKKKLQPFERVPVPGVEQKTQSKKTVSSFVRMAQAALAESNKE